MLPQRYVSVVLLKITSELFQSGICFISYTYRRIKVNMNLMSSGHSGIQGSITWMFQDSLVLVLLCLPYPSGHGG